MVNESTVLNENKNSKTQKKHPIKDAQEIFSKAVILNNRDVVKMCTVSENTKEKAKNITSKNVNSNNKLAMPNENDYLKIQRDCPIKNIKKSSFNINFNDLNVRVFNTNPMMNLCFSYFLVLQYIINIVNFDMAFQKIIDIKNFFQILFL